ncbi:MAG: DUF5615 family PIN-like protein [Planctomycetia bacterium]|nr:DUF5615 family PIN-like protein [Planctomycetia bacterium]
MKFLLDVCVSSRSLTAFLVDQGHDVVSALAIYPSASDEHLLALALKDDRVLLTRTRTSASLSLPKPVRAGRWCESSNSPSMSKCKRSANYWTSTYRS